MVMNRFPAQVFGLLRRGFSPIIILAGIAGVALLGVGGFFLFNAINTPAKVKENVSIAQPIFVQYKQSVDKIVEHLKEDGNGDSDSLERSAKKSEDLVKQAETEQANLTQVMKAITVSELQGYKKLLEDYVTVSVKIISYERENGQLADAYVKPIKDYEELTVKLSGASNYVYSDPDKYMMILASGITDEEDILTKFKKIELKYFQKYNDQFVKNISDEVDFLKNVKAAVESRKTADIAVASQKYSANTQQNSKALNRIVEQLNDDVKSLAETATSNADQINSEYNRLRTKFNF